jgi:phosphopantothenoylcysteine decarboxylase/phosphopantothenate--cysteine ligase
LIPSGFGELASGLVGEGRMAEPSEIIEHIISDLSSDFPFTDKKILITAGPTYEAIDPVRFIGNRSSGKMGIALALECADKGANIELVLGPTHLQCKHSNINISRVESADEMYKVVSSKFKKSDISIFSAAVSDYTPNEVAKIKIKKTGDSLTIDLSKTTDILSEMGNSKKDNQFVVGFALETENEFENAKLKLERKNLDMIVLNSLNNKGAGFEHNTNQVTIIDKQNNIKNFDLKDKIEVAKDIVQQIIELS